MHAHCHLGKCAVTVLDRVDQLLVLAGAAAQLVEGVQLERGPDQACRGQRQDKVLEAFVLCRRQDGGKSGAKHAADDV